MANMVEGNDEFSSFEVSSDPDRVPFHEADAENPREQIREIRKSQILAYAMTIFMFIVVLILAVMLAITNMQNSGGEKPSNENNYESYFEDVLKSMDTKIDPCEDFYMYACGGWIKNTVLPSDKVRVEKSFSDIADANDAAQLKIAASNWPLIGDLYDSCMDTSTLELLDMKPLKPYFTSLDNLSLLANNTWKFSFAAIQNTFSSLSVNVLFSTGVMVNVSNPSRYCVFVSQNGGTSLPSAEYYLDNSTLTKFQNHVSTIFSLSGLSPEASALQAAVVVEFEKKLSSIQTPPDQMRDPLATTNPISRNDLILKYPNIDWTFLKSDMLDVDSPAYFEKLNSLLSGTSAATIANYCRYKLIHGSSFSLPEKISKEVFKFYRTTLSGQTQQTPRNKSCTSVVDNSLPDILGRLFVLDHFPPESRNLAVELIKNLKSAFASRLSLLEWLDTPTRIAALYKLSNITDLVGYGDNWKTYSGLVLSKSSFFENLVAIQAQADEHMYRQLNLTVDKTIWQMTPATVNAYYDPSLNTINFPAGILQSPFFSAKFPAAANYGGIGMVVGHELVHGFDDQGSHFNGQGKLADWWTPAVQTEFSDRAQCYVNQYSQYTVNGVNVNGNLTLGENIADNGGISMAWGAYKSYSTESSFKSSTFTSDKLFFVSFAQSWCSLRTREYSLQLLRTDPHSPPVFRVNGPLSNFEPFSKTFSCPKGSNMNPVKKCSLW